MSFLKRRRKMGEKIKARKAYEGLESYDVGYEEGYNAGFDDCKNLLLQFMLEFLQSQDWLEKEN